MKSLTLPQKVQELFLPKRIEAKKLEKHFKAFPENIEYSYLLKLFPWQLCGICSSIVNAVVAK